jgi:hypothetical protein
MPGGIEVEDLVLGVGGSQAEDGQDSEGGAGKFHGGSGAWWIGHKNTNRNDSYLSIAK